MRATGIGLLTTLMVALSSSLASPAVAIDDDPTDRTTTTISTTTTVPFEISEGATVNGATRSEVPEPPLEDPALAEAPDAEAGTTSGSLEAAVVDSPALVSRTAGRASSQLQLREPPAPPTTLPPPWVLPPGSGDGRRIVYSKSNQWLWAIDEFERIVKHHPVSGRRTWNQPLPGTYRVFSRSAYTCSLDDPSVCWRYMVRFTIGPGGGNIGFHEIPTNLSTGRRLQGDWQLGTPLSAGCVRQSTDDAFWVWNWAPVGTKVVVLP